MWAASLIQRAYRGYVGRKIHRQLVMDKLGVMAAKIHRAFRRYMARQWRRERMYLEDRAVRVIQVIVKDSVVLIFNGRVI